MNWLVAVIQLTFGDVNNRLLVVKSLTASNGPGAWGLLNRAVRDRDARVRQAAITVLGSKFGAKAIGILITALQYEENEDIRMKAADLLVQSGQEAVTPLINALIISQTIIDPALPAQTLVRIGGQQVVSSLITLLQAREPIIDRTLAAQVLVKIPQTVSFLTTLINDKSGRQRDAAIEALVAVLQYVPDQRIRMSATDMLVQMGQDAVLPLIEVLRSDDPSARADAADLLVRIGEDAASPLIDALRSDNWYTRELAVRALGRIGGLEAVSSLITLINNARGPLREVVAEALGLIAGQLKTGNAGQRLAAIKALDSIGDLQAVESLGQTLEDKNPEVSWEAALVLERNPNRNAIMVRVLALEQTKGYIPGVAYLLAKYGSPDVIDRLQKHVPVIIGQLKRVDPIQRLAAVKALDVIGSSPAIEALLRTINDGDDRVSYAAAKALARRADVAAVQAKLIEWKASRVGKKLGIHHESVDTLVAVDVALNSDEIKLYMDSQTDEKRKQIRARLEAQIDKLINRYAADTFGG